MAKTGYFVMDSMEQTHKYGVTVYQVWEYAQAPDGHKVGQLIRYETSSKAKANTVCEYLTLKAEQETQAKQLTMDRYMQGGIDLLTYIPRSIKIS